ncbi:arginine--tRNA ligase [bacterium]|nr:arginine--tRNA ligase [bacterium]
MDIFKQTETDLLAIIAEYVGDDLRLVKDKIKFSVPPAKMSADYSTNAAMVLAKVKKQAPPVIAQAIASQAQSIQYVNNIDIVGGYININYTKDAWKKFLGEIILAGDHFGDGQPRERVLLEFISANPTGPLHIGHTRGAILGLALDKLLTKAGYQVTTEYYINDYGVQIHTLLRSIHFRYRQACGLDVNTPLPAGCYPGDYLLPLAASLQKKYGDRYINCPETEFYKRFKDEAVDAMMTLIRQDVADLGLTYDNFVSETKIVESGAIDQALSFLAPKKVTISDAEGQTQEVDLLYQGKLDAPLGRPANEQEQEDSRHDTGCQTLFRSSVFGDDRDRVVKRSDGSTTYFASDIAYHYDKIQRGYPILINLFGADHGGYVKRLTGVVRALSDDQTRLEVQLMQLVKLEKNGQPFKMSKRAGNFVLLSDVVKQVDTDELKLFILSKSADTPMTFDLVKVKQKSQDNPVYYIQYACTRTFSLQRKYQSVFGADYIYQSTDWADLPLEHPLIRQLASKLARYPSLIQQAARHRAPYIVVTYLQELASLFHSVWGTQLKFIDTNNQPRSQAMLALTTSVQTVLVSALACLGIKPKQEM